jgi:hypothetical protein
VKNSVAFLAVSQFCNRYDVISIVNQKEEGLHYIFSKVVVIKHQTPRGNSRHVRDSPLRTRYDVGESEISLASLPNKKDLLTYKQTSS